MKFAIYIVILALLQALVFGRIHLFGYATPLMYVYLALQMPRNTPHWLIMLLCFILGLTVDILQNTPGLAAASITLVGFLQPYILSLFLKKEDPENYRPSMHEMGFVRYLTYALILLLIFSVTLFSLEAFSFTHWVEWLLSIISSLALTTILILVYERLR